MRRPYRSWVPVNNPCPVCAGRGIVGAVAYPHADRPLEVVRCPHCSGPYLAIHTYFLPISTYHHREQS